MCSRLTIIRKNEIEPNPKKPELIIRRLIHPHGRPKVHYWIYGQFPRMISKLFYLGKFSFVRNPLGDKYNAVIKATTRKIEILNPDLHGLCRDLKIRTIRIVTTHIPIL